MEEDGRRLGPLDNSDKVSDENYNLLSHFTALVR
jgi:hypothetical protein